MLPIWSNAHIPVQGTLAYQPGLQKSFTSTAAPHVEPFRAAQRLGHAHLHGVGVHCDVLCGLPWAAGCTGRPAAKLPVVLCQRTHHPGLPRTQLVLPAAHSSFPL